MIDSNEIFLIFINTTNPFTALNRCVTGTAAFIDAEHALDPVYARNLGVNVDDLLICQVQKMKIDRWMAS